MNLLDLMVKIGVDDQATAKIRALSGTVGTGLSKAAKVGAAAMAAAGAATVAFGASSVRVGMDFDAAMSQVAATMGTTTDQIGELRDFAQEMGASTAFSATQAAEALNYMALAGYDAATSMEMLPTVLNLAAAGNFDLASASDMVTDAQSALGLSLDETTAMVDQMAAASSKTNTSVEQLGSAFLTVGGTAKVLSGGTVELSAALGILADNGIKGSEGGTALRNVLLAIQGDKFEDTFGALGVSAYDASGELRSLEDILADMNTVMDGMTTEEKTNLIANTFNARDLKSVNALLATTSDRWDEVTDAIDNSQGAAERMAATQLDNLAGDVTLFKSALEGLQIALSDEMTPALREFVQFATNGIQELTTALKEGGFDAMADKFGEIVQNGIESLSEGLPQFIEAGGRILGAIASGLLQALPELITGFGEALVTLINYMAEHTEEFMNSAGEMFMAILQALAEVSPQIQAALINLLISLLQYIVGKAGDMLQAGLQLLGSLLDGAIQKASQIPGEVANWIGNAVSAALGFLGSMLSAGSSLISNLLSGASSIGETIASTVSGWIDSAVSKVLGFVDSFYNAGSSILGGLIDGIRAGFDRAAGAVSEGLENIRSFLPFSPAKRGPFSGRGWTLYSGMSLMEGLAEGIEDASATAERSMLDAISGVHDAMGDYTAAVSMPVSTAYARAGSSDMVIAWLSENLGDIIADYTPVMSRRDFDRMARGAVA